MAKALKILYDCDVCPAYCCSYPRIIVDKKDLQRLARYFGLSQKQARKKFTKKGEEPGQRRTEQRRNRLARLRAGKMGDSLLKAEEQERRKRKSR